MYKSTRDFIVARQKYTPFKLTLPTHVKKIGGGEPNNCFNNATAVVEDGKSRGIKFVALSGWLVQPYDKKNKCTGIIQHWWNADSAGNHFDTTPMIDNGEEYVFDFAIYEYSRINFQKIKSNVTRSLLYINGEFEILVDTENMLFKKIPELRTELFFEYE